MKAIWNHQVLAQSSDTVVVESNHYFPADAINPAYFRVSDHTSYCRWKGEANYYTIVVDGQENPNAAWFYSAPKPEAQRIAGHIAFWKGVEVVAS